MAPKPPPAAPAAAAGPAPTAEDYNTDIDAVPEPPKAKARAATHRRPQGDDDDEIDMSLTRLADAPPQWADAPQTFRQPRTKAEKIERWKNIARTFSPFFYADDNTTPVPQFNNYIWQQQAPVVTPEPFTFAPFSIPTLATVAPAPGAGPTLESFLPTTASPKLLAHNTARMIREIATFSDGGKSRDQDFGAVQTLMQAFFEAVATGNNGAPAAATGPALGGPLGDAPMLQARRDGTELGANRALTNKLFESDMVLTVPQMKAIVLAAQEARNPHGRKKRKVITGSVYRWKSVIPYRFKGGDAKWKKLIKEGLSLWEKETCVRWSENGPGKDYVIFFRGSGCYSSVGRTGGSQLISIGYGCEDKGIVAHEVGHSLGFWHEQSRPDRDQYIHLRKEWIIKGTDGNFEKRSWEEIEDMGVPYDIGSVMHYGSNAFTKDWDQITIETRDSRYQGTIGQRQKLSFIDVKQVNRLYCNSVCPVALPCLHGGYPDPNNCSVCKCPDGLGGKLCGRVAKGTDHDKCGGELVAGPEWQEMIYKGKRTCNWRVKSPNGGRVRMVFTELRYQCATSCKAYIEVKHNTDFQQTGFRVCCFNKTYDVISDQSEALILSNANIVDYEVSYKLQWIQDNGKPLPPPKPTSTWVPGKENRPFRGVENTGGSIEKFILQAIPKIRDSHRPLESITSIVAEYGLATLLGISHNGKK
ncbi:CBN-NAS-30 protein [Caenorhabditis brenneri]|uniref:Metalloendopeptidase n=1 Tax=Caenorhabditis brenneri TaxID=135651 RepID=G0NV87_CAEBE|nr:CBN-NAS-30 protein [Caenorhabditis brenneri]